MEQLILHLLGDYVLQSSWMANNKAKESWPCLCHAFWYSLPFILLNPSSIAWLTIFGTHYLIDRYRIARYVCYWKNILFAPRKEWMTVTWNDDDTSDWEPVEKYIWTKCQPTGYTADTPEYLAVWLLILVDNCMHLAINYLALRYL